MLTSTHFSETRRLSATHVTRPEWVPIPYASLDIKQVEDIDGREVEVGGLLITGELEHFLALRGEIDMIIAELSGIECGDTGPAVAVGS